MLHYISTPNSNKLTAQKRASNGDTRWGLNVLVFDLCEIENNRFHLYDNLSFVVIL